MIETKEALEKLDEIMSVKGVDGIYIGPADLSLALGEEPGFDKPENTVAYKEITKILEAAKKRSLFAGIHNGTAEYAKKMIEKGFNLVTVGSDQRFMSSGAKTAIEKLDNLIVEVKTILDPIKDKKFVVFHDAYQYFENDFDISASGAISIGDASDPSPARLAEVRKRVVDEGIECVLAEPQYKKGLVKAVIEETNSNTTVIDPLGVKLKPGPELYEQLIRNLATNLAGCF